ncbi:MAG TPA: DegV family protein [Candidatus Limnocylindria bacterium]|jgi:DegV family protein with EDD domain|nr:DegV family protein [Candidatus Limnocylindria bacterium]
MSDRSAIILDGTAALSDEMQRDFAFRTLPVHVIFGDEDFTAGVDLTAPQFYEKLVSSKKMPTTAAPSLGECLDLYERVVHEGYRSILVITVIAEASVTHSVAKTAAQQVNGARIEVVDSRTTAGGISLIGTACARALRDGQSFDQSVTLAKRLAGRVQILALLDTLEYLRRGGRVSGAQAAFGALLSIKPIVEVKDGDRVLVDKVRTRERGVERLKQLIEQRVPAGARIHACAMHTNQPERAIVLGDWVRERFHCLEYFTADAGPTIGTHTGPGVTGLCWYREEDARA